MIAIVHSLHRAPKGEPYEYRSRELPSIEDAGAFAAVLWRNVHTLAVVVFLGELEDARYARVRLDERRLPDAWPRVPPSPESTVEEPRPPAPAPDLGELFGAPTRAVTPKDGCRCCGGDRGPHEGDVDKTPSGRINDRRCAVCGRRMPGNTGDVYRMYMRYQRVLSEEQKATKHTPWKGT